MAGTRLISGGFLTLNILLILYDWRMYAGFLSTLLARPVPRVSTRWGTAARLFGFFVPATVIAVFLLIFRGQVAEMMDPITDFTGSR